MAMKGSGLLMHRINLYDNKFISEPGYNSENYVGNLTFHF